MQKTGGGSAWQRLPFFTMSGSARARQGLLILLMATAAALAGSSLLRQPFAGSVPGAAPNPYGLILLALAAALWLLGEITADGPAVRDWLRRPGRKRDWQDAALERARERELAEARQAAGPPSSRYRLLATALALFGSYLAYRFNGNNQFSVIGFWSWLASIALWLYALTGRSPRAFWRSLLSALRRQQPWRIWREPALLLLLVITLLAAIIRLHELNELPPEMVSDHVEAIHDGYGIAELGDRRIFFTNTGGREAFHFYALALLAQLPGLGHDFYTLKLLTVLEGLLAIPCVYWLGRMVFTRAARLRPPADRSEEELGRLAGLLMAAFLAVSYWHIYLSRGGLRWAPTVVVCALLLGYLARALRDNQRADYIRAGLVLGFGLYTYQAVRMLPLLVVVGVALALIFYARDWRARGRYLLHLALLALLAFAIYVPFYRFSNDNLESFMMRTWTRIVGDGVPMEDTFDLVEEIVARFPELLANLRDSLLMFNWRGDGNWFHGAPGKPAMDPWAGAFFALGVVAWLARWLRRRDIFSALLPFAMVITLLPAALALAFPAEVPGHTRGSASLPIAFLIAALPPAILLQNLRQQVIRAQWPAASAWLAGAALLLIILIGGYTVTREWYFQIHREYYLDSSRPHREYGEVARARAEELGYGNFLILPYAHWLDNRGRGHRRRRAGLAHRLSAAGRHRAPSLLRQPARQPIRAEPGKRPRLSHAPRRRGRPGHAQRALPRRRRQRRGAHPIRRRPLPPLPRPGGRCARVLRPLLKLRAALLKLRAALLKLRAALL